MGETDSNLKAAAVVGTEHWREAMAQLRHLSDDVWKGLKLFLSVNALIVVGIVGLLAFCGSRFGLAVLLGLLSALGAALTLTARYILKRHRIYYLQMLAKKSLIEDELGFYRTKLAGSEADLAFPWRVTPEVVGEIKQNPEAWIQKLVRANGTIALWQFLIYEVLIGFYAVVLFFAVLRFLG
jgi:hypothetical protein